jgi:hypothetical protein
MKNNLLALLMMRWARMVAEGIAGTKHSGGVGGGLVCTDNVSNGVILRIWATRINELSIKGTLL